MKKLFLILIIGLVLIGAIAPIFANAQEDVQVGPKGGLVPCGRAQDDPDTDNIDETVSCHLCHLFMMFERIIDFVLAYIVPSITALMILFGGFLFMFAGASAEQLSKAKSIFTTVIIGIVLIYASYIIVNTFMTAVGVADWTGLDSWYELELDDCPMSPSEVDNNGGGNGGSNGGGGNGNGNSNIQDSISCEGGNDQMTINYSFSEKDNAVHVCWTNTNLNTGWSGEEIGTGPVEDGSFTQAFGDGDYEVTLSEGDCAWSQNHFGATGSCEIQ